MNFYKNVKRVLHKFQPPQHLLVTWPLVSSPIAVPLKRRVKEQKAKMMMVTMGQIQPQTPPRGCSLGLSCRFQKKTHRLVLDRSWWMSKKRTIITSNNLITDPNSFQVGRLIGTYGFINITSYSGMQSGMDIEYSPQDIGLLRTQNVGEGNIKIRLYDGRIAQGPYTGTPVIFKVYPGKQVGGTEADMMAANELNAHILIQSSETISEHVQILLGGFETKTGEQWLAFRNDGKLTAADYAKYRSEKNLQDSVLGEARFWNRFEKKQTIKRRRFFITKILYGALSGLAYLHEHDRLHQSLGPASIVLNTITEREAVYLNPRIRDLSFSVDIRYSKLEENSGSLAEGLWSRAKAAGAFTPMQKRAFGIADDIYEAGLLLAYLAFIPFCEGGTMDSLSLQRLLESTFRLDLEATREYCLADDNLSEAVKYLDLGNGAGWELLQAMLNPDFRKRPVAEAILKHRFMTGAVL